MKKLAVMLCLLWLARLALPIFGEQKAHAMEGFGTEEEPYIIMTPEDLSNIRHDMGAHYKLGADIDLAGYDYDGSGPDNGGWMPIGNGQMNAFTGTLDGNGFAILNMTIDRPANDFVGLFGWVGPNGKLINIRLLDVDVRGDSDVGSLAGVLASNGTIENSYATGRVQASSHDAGGLVAANSGTIRNAYAAVEVGGWIRVGGLVGSNQGVVENVFAVGSVRGNGEIGGLIGYHSIGTSPQGIHNAYAAGKVTGNVSISTGGLVGRFDGDTIESSFWNTETSGQTSSARGTGITTEQMKDADTFAAWDAAVWGFHDGKTFPYLRSLPMAIGVDPLDPTTYSLHPGQDTLSVTGSIWHDSAGEPIAVKYVIRDDTDAILAETDFLTSDGDGDLPFKHKFSLAGFDNGDYTLSITATDTRHAVAGITLGFTVDQAAPAPPSVVFGTNGSEVWAQTASTTVTVIDTGGGVDASSLQYAWAADPVPPAPGPAWTSFASGEALPKSGVDGDWYLHIRAKDSNGSLANVVSNRFRLDNTPPEVHFAPNGNAAPSKTAESTITVTDAASGIDAASLQYVWTQSAVTPADGWTGFANGDTLELKSGDGNWYLHVRAQDAVGNLIEAASGAFVLDNTAPVIALNGSNPMTVEANSPFTDPGATAHDSQDGDLSSAIVVTGSVDTAVPGTYTLHYNVSDAAGNAAEEVTRTVRVVRQYASSPVSVPDRPFIDLNGDKFDPSAIDTAKPSVTLEVAPKDNTAYVSIPASVLSGIAEQNSAFIIEIKAPYGSFRVPVELASLIPGLTDLLAANHLSAEDISFRITLTDKTGDKEIRDALASRWPDGNVMGAVVDFHLEIVSTRTGEIVGTADRFSKALARVIPMPKDIAGMPEHWGAFRYNETAERFEFVPAQAVEIDGVWYVMIRSYSNSVYVTLHNAASFRDVRQHWAQSHIELAAAKGLVEGVGGGRYHPAKAVTRAEFTAMLVRALGRGAAAGSAAPYRDVKQDAWYFDDVAAARELGLLNFVNGDRFHPNRLLTREEMAGMLAAAVRLEQPPVTEKKVDLNKYKDIGSVDAAYLEDIRLMVQLHIMEGRSADTFNPKETTTRAEAAVVFIRALRAMGMID